MVSGQHVPHQEEKISLYSHLKSKYSKYSDPGFCERFKKSSRSVLIIGFVVIATLWLILWWYGYITFPGMKDLGNGMNLNLSVLAANAILIVLTTSIVYFYKESAFPFEKSDAIHNIIKESLLKKHGKADEIFIIDFDAKNRDDLNFLRVPTNTVKDFSKLTHVYSLALIFITTGLAIIDIPVSAVCSDGFKGFINVSFISFEILTFILLSYYGIRYLKVAIQIKNDVLKCIDSNHYSSAYLKFKEANKGFKPDTVIHEMEDILNKK